MNKIYRLVWNRETGTMVVASELAKSDSAGVVVTRRPGRSRLALLAMAVMMALPMGSAWAADYVCVDPATGQPMPPSSVPGPGSEVACGEGAVAAGRDSIAIGTGAKTAGAAQSAIAIGTNATVTQQNSFAFGTNTQATGTNSLAVGNAAKASGQSSAAFGDGANASGGWTTAVGVATAASAAGASAFGHAAKANGEHSTAIGSKAEAQGKTSVSLGYDAGVVNPTIANTAQLENTVNIGNSAGKSTTSNIHGIAIGAEAGQRVSTAVNGGQNIAIGRKAGQDVTGNTNVALSSEAGQHVSGHDNFAAMLRAGQYVTGNNNIAIGKEAGSGTAAAKMTASDTIALGYQTKATQNKAIALGGKTEALAIGAVVIGGWGNPAEALGNRATISKAPYSVVLGTAAQANEFSDSAVVIGNQAEARGASNSSTAKDSVTIGYRSLVTTASNIAIGSNAKADGKSQATAIGNYANAKGYQSIALGSLSYADSNAGSGLALGREARVTTGNAVALGSLARAERIARADEAGTDAAATLANGKVYANAAASQAAKDAVSATVQRDENAPTTVALGAVSVGYDYTDTNGKRHHATRQITHVAAGTENSDAVNVAQLKAVAEVAEKPLTFAGDVGTNVTRKLGETVNLTGGMDDESKLTDDNIGVVANGSDTLEIKLAKDLTDLSSAEFEDADGNLTIVDGNGISISPADPSKAMVSLTSAGLNNGGNQITNVASGGDVDTNAANIGDVKAAAAKATTKVDAGDNIEVATTTNTDGSTTYTVATKKDVAFDKVTVGGVTIDKNT
ncbi:MAG: ESPR-type extended signal peptide-containing protein, partial [Pseudomonadota bacterium]|nr:ESPR-type extended signal peptide-containing protein [Pseudomonadota bacterium]